MIDYKPFDKVKTWYLVFDKARGPRRFWHLVLKARFKHCYALAEAGEGHMRFEPLAWGICCHYQTIALRDMLLGLAQSDTTAIVSVTVDYRKVSEVSLRGLYNCVTMLKALLAIRKRLLFTPFQLYKYAVRYMRCIVIKPYVPYLE